MTRQGVLGLDDTFAREELRRRLSEAIRGACDRISLKELAFKLDVQGSYLADALAERAHKGVRASWLVEILDLAPRGDAIAILNVLASLHGLEVVPRRTLTPEELNQRFEEKLRSLGEVGMQLIRDVKGDQ